MYRNIYCRYKIKKTDDEVTKKKKNGKMTCEI